MRPDRQTISDAIRLIAARSGFSLVWLDLHLRITNVLGEAGRLLESGDRAMDVFPFLFGFEQELRKLSPASEPLTIPSVAMVDVTGRLSARYDVSVYHNDGSGYLIHLAPILAPDSSTSDLEHEQKRVRLMERDLAERALEIERINAQLEDFNYVISHDLNAPLRAIRHLLEKLQRDLQAATSELASTDRQKLHKCIVEIDRQTRRMSNMLVGLLEYSRVGKAREIAEPVDTRALVREIVRSLKPGVAVTISVHGDWPILETARAPLDLVLRNLIDNALKHHDRPDRGRIGVTSHSPTEGARYWRIDVSDDGPGIAPEWHEAIFEMFRQVGDNVDTDGTGLGLALIRNAVRNLGGEVTVRSNAPRERGAVFTVNWPVRLPGTENS